MAVFALAPGLARAQPATPASVDSPTPAPTASPESPSAGGDRSPDATAKLQQEASNPIGSLISIPFQYNVNFDVGTYRHAQQVLNLQPVVPFDLGKGHTLIVRDIQSFIALPQLNPSTGSTVGIGDNNPQLFYVPKQGGTMIGYGPTFIFPTATSATLGQGKWSIGPNAVIVITRPSTLYGLLINNVWSVAGDSSRANVNQLFAQPFYNWTLPKGWTVGVQSLSTANWNAPGNQKWTVPFGTVFSRLVKLGDGTGQIGGAFFWNVVHPYQAGNWTARAVLVILSPAK